MLTLDRPDLIRIGLDPPVGDQETKELPRRYAEDAFLGVKLGRSRS
jgi:hypothetical protein